MNIQMFTHRSALLLAIGVALLALACGPANPGKPTEQTAGGGPPSADPPVSGLADFEALAKGKAPGGLAGLQAPDIRAQVLASFEKLPAQIGGKTFHDYFNNSTGSTRFQSVYGENGPFGYPLFIGAYDVGYMTHYVPNPQVAGDFGSKVGDWTAGQWVANVVKDQAPWDDDLPFGDTIAVQESGRDGSMAWVRFTGEIPSQNGRNVFATVHGVAWGAEKGKWFFVGLADSRESADELLGAFSGAVRGKPVAPSARTQSKDAEYGAWQVFTPTPPPLQDVPGRPAPGALKGLKPPATVEAIRAVFNALPNEVGGYAINDPMRTGASGPGQFWVHYGTRDRIGNREVHIKVSAADIAGRLNYPYPADWTAAHFVAYAMTDKYLQTTHIVEDYQWGRDGALVWSSYVTKSRTGGSTDAGLPVYKINYVTTWASETGAYMFTAEADTAAGRDAAVAAFAATVGR